MAALSSYGSGISLELAQKSLDALWLKQTVISSNLANVDTPGYKSRTVEFESILEDALSQAGSLTESDLDSIEAEVKVDYTTAAREDGNNVDVDAESIELARVQMQYEYLIRAVSSELERTKYVVTETT